MKVIKNISKAVSILVFTLAVAVQGPAAHAKNVVIVRKGLADFDEVKKAIAMKLKSHKVVDIVLTKDASYEEFEKPLMAAKPDVIVVMDNKFINYAMRLTEKTKSLRGVATMGINLKKVLEGNKSLSGVAFEAPALQIVSKFRYIASKPVKTVLTVYQDDFRGVVNDAKEQLARVGIKLVALKADTDDDDDLKEFLEEAISEETIKKEKADAIWVMTDSVLLSPELFAEVWVPRSKSLKVPFLCGVDKFASKEMDFCVYSASPNYKDLGYQVADMVQDVLDRGQATGVDYIVSVKRTINTEKLNRIGITVNQARLNEE